MGKLLLAVLVAVGCSGSGAAPVEPVPPAAVCAQRTGAYRIHYVMQSGTCAPMADEVFAVGDNDPTCTPTSQNVSIDLCEVDATVVCVDSGGETILTGFTRWTPDALGAAGTVVKSWEPRALTPAEAYARSIYGGPPLPVACASTYDTGFTRL